MNEYFCVCSHNCFYGSGGCAYSKMRRGLNVMSTVLSCLDYSCITDSGHMSSVSLPAAAVDTLAQIHTTQLMSVCHININMHTNS